jgi:hypothetical protein
MRCRTDPPGGTAFARCPLPSPKRRAAPGLQFRADNLLVALVATLMLVGIPLLIVGAIAWVVLASLAAVKASHGQAYRYPPTMRLVRSSDQAQGERPTEAGSPWLVPRSASSPPLGTPPR